MRISERVHRELAERTRFGDIRLLETVDSTNHYVADAARQGAAEGLVVVADHQTAGRGRLGRAWEAPRRGSLLMSVLLRPDALGTDRLHLVGALVGLAAADACHRVGGFMPEIKWPNDLLFGSRKMAGVLAEVIGAGEGQDLAVVVGLGLNVSAAPDGGVAANEAAGRPVATADLLVAVLGEIDGRYGRWDEVADEYRRRCATVGRRVRVVAHDGTERSGTARRLDAGGRLVIAFDGAQDEEALSAGDVFHLRPAAGATW